jgi:hypothetical protein
MRIASSSLEVESSHCWISPLIIGIRSMRLVLVENEGSSPSSGRPMTLHSELHCADVIPMMTMDRSLPWKTPAGA